MKIQISFDDSLIEINETYLSQSSFTVLLFPHSQIASDSCKDISMNSTRRN